MPNDSNTTDSETFDFCEYNICPAYIIGEINLAVGLVGNILSLLAFIKKYKANNAYIYQLLIILLDLISIPISFLAYGTDFHFQVWDNLAPEFVQNSPFLLKLSAMGYDFSNMSHTAFLIVLVGVSADRFQALTNPFSYKLHKHERRAIVLFVVSVTVGFTVSIPELFWFTTVHVPETDSYLLVEREGYNDYLIVKLTGYLRLGLKFVLLLGVIVLSVLIVVKYTKKHKQHKSIHATTYSQQQQKPVDEKALAVLLLAQNVLVVAASSVTMTWYFNSYAFGMEWSHPVQLTINSMIVVLRTACRGYNFLLYMMISGEFRNAVMAVIKRKDLNQVQPSGSVPRSVKVRGAKQDSDIAQDQERA